MPSTASEGFPKVIAEAACYGIIPIVSDVGSIAHYIDDENGFVWKLNTSDGFSKIVNNAVEMSNPSLKEKSKKVQGLAEEFTFLNYFKKLNKHIFN